MKSCEWIHTNICFKKGTAESVIMFECSHECNQVVEQHDDTIKHYIGVRDTKGLTIVHRVLNSEEQLRIYNELRLAHCI